jgi:hypothetical protein
VQSVDDHHIAVIEFSAERLGLAAESAPTDDLPTNLELTGHAIGAAETYVF